MNLLERMKSIENDLGEIKTLLQNQQKSTGKIKEILTAQETMDMLNINRNTFNNWRSIGFIKVYQINRRLYTKYSEVMQSLENGMLEAS